MVVILHHIHLAIHFPLHLVQWFYGLSSPLLNLQSLLFCFLGPSLFSFTLSPFHLVITSHQSLLTGRASIYVLNILIFLKWFPLISFSLEICLSASSQHIFGCSLVCYLPVSVSVFSLHPHTFWSIVIYFWRYVFIKIEFFTRIKFLHVLLNHSFNRFKNLCVHTSNYQGESSTNSWSCCLSHAFQVRISWFQAR